MFLNLNIQTQIILIWKCVKTKLTDGTAVDALGEFLSNLHFQGTGNVKQGLEYYLNKSQVDPEYSRFRDAVLKQKKPRKMVIQANTFSMKALMISMLLNMRRVK